MQAFGWHLSFSLSAKIVSKTRFLRHIKAVEHFIPLMRSWYSTNRFHLVVRVYLNNEQMTSKRDKNKEVRYEPQASSVTDVLATF